MLKVGLIGYGAIGKNIAAHILENQAGRTHLSAVLVRNENTLPNVSVPDCVVTADKDEFFDQAFDIVIEAAGHEALKLLGEKALANGNDLIILSVGALADPKLYENLKSKAAKHKKKMIIPSGAIAGLDRIASGSIGEIKEITLVTRKPTKSWYGTIAEQQVDLENIKEPYCIFEGNAKNAATLFPESVNASATLSLAGVGLEETKVQVYVDPTIEQNVHTILAEGEFGKVEVSIENSPSKINPKSSPIVAMSVAKVLQNLTSEVVVGI